MWPPMLLLWALFLSLINVWIGTLIVVVFEARGWQRLPLALMLIPLALVIRMMWNVISFVKEQKRKYP